MRKKLTEDQVTEIKRLAEAGHSIRTIAKEFCINKSTVYYHVKDSCRKMTAFDAGLLDEAEKGYIIGLFLGDGSFNKGYKEKRFFIRFALDAERDKDVALRLAQIFGKAGKKICFISWKSNIIAKTCSKELVAYIQRFVEYEQDGKYLLLNESWSDNFKYGFLAGIIDSDGHVHQHLGTEIKTVSRKVFENILEVLNGLQISANNRMRNAPKNSFSKKPRYIIYIPSSEMKRIKGSTPSAKVARYL